jgi:flavin-dependent dehydrogenase
VYTYVEGLEADGNEWHYAPAAAAGLIPTNDGRTCVFAGRAATPGGRERRGTSASPAATFERLLAQVSPVLARRIEAGRRVERYRLFAGRPGFFRRPHGPGWALVGDAGYFKDPITAHGISDALRDAELLARAIDADDLPGYGTARDAVSADLFGVTDAIARYDWQLDELQELLFDLSRSMQAELALVRSWPTGASAPNRNAA